MRFALVGQPNCGKSTLFNQVAGYKAATGNFSGTTVTFTETKVRVLGDVVELVDLPGTYSLLGTNPAERVVLDYLVSNEVDAIINVVDATHLAQGLALTLELLELKRPVVLAVNMMDEATRQGMQIDGEKLARITHIPVLPVIATKGQGVRNVFASAFNLAREKKPAVRQTYSPELETHIKKLTEKIVSVHLPVGSEALALKLLEGDPQLIHQVSDAIPGIENEIQSSVDELCHITGRQAVWLVSKERHDLALKLSDQVLKKTKQGLSFRDRLDDYLLHPVFGYVFLIIIMFLFFWGVNAVGGIIEEPLMIFADQLNVKLLAALGEKGLLAQILSGALQGFTGGLAIVLPYLVPFQVGLGFLEDVGYLPRIAFLMDSLMHRMGLHGKAVVPFILGYGCNVSSIMSTRILEDKRDRFLASLLSSMVPCSARMAVIFGLAAFYLGPAYGVGIYFLNIVVIALTGRIITRFLPEDSPGLILEMPVYRMPSLRTVTAKAWLRIREFIVEAWPLLILGSIVLAVMNYYQLSQFTDVLFRPITWLLGLPSQVGTPLIFGILRKELSLVMLGQALGSMNFSQVLTQAQMLTYTIFVVFYVPCLATLIAIRKELGTKKMFAIIGITLLVAILASLLVRLVMAPILG
ncbi:MAG TPA: ferrous iron transport protein B [Anaerolineaceae bacterium]|nr:ferrous iron transport protein B [Anaerolineaceae bacterium]